MKVLFAVVCLFIVLPGTICTKGEEERQVRKCYVCGPTTDNCEDNRKYDKDSADIKTCDSGEEKCMKTIGADGLISRSCSTICPDSSILGHGGFCCDTDGCNSGSKVGFSLFLLLLPLIAIFLRHAF